MDVVSQYFRKMNVKNRMGMVIEAIRLKIGKVSPKILKTGTFLDKSEATTDKIRTSNTITYYL